MSQSRRCKNIFLVFLALLFIHVNQQLQTISTFIQLLGNFLNRNNYGMKIYGLQRNFQKKISIFQGWGNNSVNSQAMVGIVMRGNVLCLQPRPSHASPRKNWKFLHFHFKTFDTFLLSRLGRGEVSSSLPHQVVTLSLFTMKVPRLMFLALFLFLVWAGPGLKTVCREAAMAVVLPALSLELD